MNPDPVPPCVYHDMVWEVFRISQYELQLLPIPRPFAAYRGYRFRQRQGKIAWAVLDGDKKLQFHDPDRITNCRIRERLCAIGRGLFK